MQSHLMSDERQYVFDTIGSFLSDASGAWDWDDFTSCSLRSAKLDHIRRQAADVDLPLNSEGRAILETLLVEVERLTSAEASKPKPWRTEVGMAWGMAVGVALWWGNFVEGGGWLQNPQLLVLPTAIGGGIVALRNKRHKVGLYDPEIIARNMRGRV